MESPLDPAGVAYPIVSTPPAGVGKVSLLLCAIDDCSDQMFWVSHEPGLEDEPIVPVDTLLAEDAATAAQGEGLAAEFRERLAEARRSAAAKAWQEVEFRLDDAEQVLQRWRGTPTNQELFDVAFLRGAATVGRGRGAARDAMSRAAAVSWNRRVSFPVADEAAVAAYDTALAEVIGTRPGTLELSPGTADPTYTLDGVPLGSGPVQVLVYAGTHRLTATEARRGLEWRASVTVLPGTVTRATARFPGGEDPAWVAGRLAEAVHTRRLEPEIADLLGSWADRHAIKEIRFLRLDPVPPPVVRGGPGKSKVAAPEEPPVLFLYGMTSVYYQPGPRRFSVEGG